MYSFFYFLRGQKTLQEGVALSHISSPAQYTNHRILVNRETIRIEWNHITTSMRPEMYIISIQEVHSISRDTTNCASAARSLERKWIIRLTLIATIHNHVAIKIFKRHKAAFS